jgi:hypothetical protein
MEARFDALEQRLATPDERLSAARADKPATDWPALYTWLELWRLDDEATRQELRLTSEAQLLARFGPRTTVWARDNGPMWVYQRDLDTTTNQYTTEIQFRLQEGRVVEVWVTLP